MAVALLAVAIFCATRISDMDSKINDLEGEVGLVQGQAAELAKSTGNETEDELLDLERRLRKVEACIPEVQNEISALGVEVEAGFAYIENNSQVSTYCQSVVYPQTQGDP